MIRAPDVRLRVLAASVGLIIVISLLVSLLPQGIDKTPAPASLEEAATAMGPDWDADRHQSEKRSAEIALAFRQATLMLHARSYDNAITALHRVLKLAPDMPEAHVNMGYALLEKGEHRAARDFFLAAVDLRPEQSNAYYGLAVSLERDCDLESAIGAMRTFVHLTDPDDRFLSKARAALWEWESVASSAQASTTIECPQPNSTVAK